jgi:hypothetical protein
MQQVFVNSIAFTFNREKFVVNHSLSYLPITAVAKR